MRAFPTTALTAVLAVLLSALLPSCGSGPDFRIDGEVDGLGTQNLRVVYYSDGAVQQVSAPAIDGKFSMMGRTSEPTMIWIYNNAGRLVGRAIAEGGDKIEARYSVVNPLNISLSGNDDAELLAKFMTDNATLLAKKDAALKDADIDALNAAVERFVRKNRDTMAAAAVLTEFYTLSGGRAAKARELMELIDSDERPASITAPFIYSASEALFPDSLMTARRSPLRSGLRVWSEKADSVVMLGVRGNRRTLLMFTDESARRADSVAGIASQLASIAGVRVADVSVDADTLAWKRSLGEGASADVARYWALGGPAATGVRALKISDIPFFVVADSTTRILYRGSSARRAVAAARK